MYIYLYLSIYLSLSLYIYIYIYMCTYMHIHAHTCTYIGAFISDVVGVVDADETIEGRASERGVVAQAECKAQGKIFSSVQFREPCARRCIVMSLFSCYFIFFRGCSVQFRGFTFLGRSHKSEKPLENTTQNPLDNSSENSLGK